MTLASKVTGTTYHDKHQSLRDEAKGLLASEVILTSQPDSGSHGSYRCTGAGTRNGCPPFARGPTASLRLVNDAHPLLHTREGVPEPSPLPFAPPLRSAHPSVSAQLPYPGRALPRPHTLCVYAGGRCDLTLRVRACVRPSPLRAPLGGGTRKPGLRGGDRGGRTVPRVNPGARGGRVVPPAPPGMQGEGEAVCAGWAGVARAEGTGVGAPALLRHQACAGAAREGGRGGVARTEGTGGGGDAERSGGVVCPHVAPFRANEERRGRGECGDGVPCAHPFRWEGRDRGRRTLGRGGRGATGAVRPRAPPLPRERGGAVRPLSACERGGGGQCGGRKGGGCATYHGVPPFRANVAARTGGKGEAGAYPVRPSLCREERGVGLPSCVPFSTRMGWARGAGGVEGGAGVLRSCTPNSVRIGTQQDGGGIGGMVQQFWTLRRKQNVPATIGCAKSVGRPPLPPLLPLPSPTPSASKRGRKRAGRRPSPPCIERGAQGGHTMIRGVRRLPVRAEGGAHEGVPLPSPPALLSPVRAAPFTRKGGARGYAAPGPSLPIGRGAHKVRRRRPLPGPSVPHLRGRGPHEGTPPHPTSPRRPRPQFPPSGPRHPGLPHAPRPRTPGDAEGPARPPRSLQRGRRQPSPAHTASPSPCMPGGAGGTTRPPLAPGFTRGTVRPPRSPPRYAQPRVCAHRPARACPGA
ncbi:hypothetical protein EDB84DRAFT_1440548 [Lactarius hengduanensis]|nr:hypothetical protein EDB84DRAFT_1440548 [Lactarius hengduanensis]